MSTSGDGGKAAQEFEELLEYVKRSRGFDFTGYKRSSLQRRVSKRMQTLTLERFGDYLDDLEVHPEEFVRLFNILTWNHHATELWGLHLEEIQNRSFMGLDIGLPVEQLRGLLFSLLHGESAYQESVLDSINRRGRAIRCRVTCTPLLGVDHDVQGVILLMEEWGTHA